MLHKTHKSHSASRIFYKRLNSVDEPTYHLVIEQGTADCLEVFGYCHNNLKRSGFFILVIFTLGFTLLVARWKPVWKVWLTCVCCSVATADTLIVKDSHGQLSVEKIMVQPINALLPSEIVYCPVAAKKNSKLCDQTCRSHAYRYFLYRNVKFVWDNQLTTFKRLRGYDRGMLCSDFYEKFHGLLATEQEQKLQLYGLNTIDVEVKSYCRLLFDEVLNPFYFFQVASIILWIVDEYIYYASCIFIISVLSIITSLYQTKKQRITLRNMVAQSNSETVTVCRQEGVLQDIPAAKLVPGDLLVIPPHGCLMSCDAVLIAGNCIVNESMLTGESVPEVKTPLKSDREVYHPQSYKKHTLFCGTKVIQTRYYGQNKVFAVVIRTGFSTSKGELVRSILFSQPLSFKFYRDAMKFVFLLFCISAVGMAYSLYCYIKMNAPVQETVIRALDLVTIVVPPALPAAMTIGTVCAQSRLKKKGIYCISPSCINVCGKVNIVCFDKTGTLTEEGLSMWGVVPCVNGSFHSLVKDPVDLDDKEPLKAAMACCHSLTVIDGELKGDPLDLRMFTSTKWVLEEPGTDTTKYDIIMPTVVRPPVPNSVLPVASVDQYTNDLSLQDICNKIPLEIGIIRIFPFSSNLQRMSVICRILGAKCMNLYVKGAPEQVVGLCIPDSVPRNFYDVLHNYTVQGFRVIALAWRLLDRKLSWHHAQRITREHIECDFTFLGLLIMQNTLKVQSTPVINMLRKASIHTVMITGDNLLTAVSVARDCNMICETDKVFIIKAHPPEQEISAWLECEDAEIPNSTAVSRSLSIVSSNGDSLELAVEEEGVYHFAVDGKSFGILHTYFCNILPKLLVRCTVFARMSPEQKTQVIEALQQLEYVVGMCGDGANDCGALKAADFGISLSESEASVAAPFTSHIPNIKCVPVAIGEGRCSLVTAFSVFKFITLYSLIQFISVLVLYTVKTNFTDAMFLYVDLGVITSLAVVMSYTGACEKLVAHPPPGSLISVVNVSSLLLQIILVISVEIASIFFLRAQSWYYQLKPSEYAEPSWENTTIFFLSCFQYIIMAVVFSKGPPYRKPFYTNGLFLGTLIILTVFTNVLLFCAYQPLSDFFQLISWNLGDHFYFRLSLFLIACCNFVLSLVAEILVVHMSRLKRWFQTFMNIPEKKHKYKEIEDEMKSVPNWLPFNEPLYENVYHNTSTEITNSLLFSPMA